MQIGSTLVSEEVVTEYFCCDYPVCKGICCVEGDSGAPLEEEELEGLESGYPEYGSLMSPEGHAAVKKEGFFSIDRDGDLVTPLIEGTEACAYSKTDADGNLLCCIECCALVKPMSCKLYPIRITKLTGGGLALNLHRWDVCAPAFEKGKREGIRVYQFLKKPLTERFGEDFYQMLDAAARHINSDNE